MISKSAMQSPLFEIESTCKSICQSGPKGICLGCGRTREERLHFHSVPIEVKDVIVRTSSQRLSKINAIIKKKRIDKQREALGDDVSSDAQMSLF